MLRTTAQTAAFSSLLALALLACGGGGDDSSGPLDAGGNGVGSIWSFTQFNEVWCGENESLDSHVVTFAQHGATLTAVTIDGRGSCTRDAELDTDCGPSGTQDCWDWGSLVLTLTPDATSPTAFTGTLIEYSGPPGCNSAGFVDCLETTVIQGTISGNTFTGTTSTTLTGPNCWCPDGSGTGFSQFTGTISG